MDARTAWRSTAPKGASACPTQTPSAGRSRYSEAERRVGGRAPLARLPENSRGLGVADLATALRDGGQPRASGAQAFHVLEIMHAIHTSAAEARHVELSSPYARPPRSRRLTVLGEADAITYTYRKYRT